MNTVKNNKHIPFIIGLTGGIATGKSSVVNILSNKGYFVIDTDAITKELWEDANICKKIKDTLNIENKENIKSIVKKIILIDESKRKLLNNILHPLIFKKIDEIIGQNKNNDIIFIDMPLLFEVDYKNIDFTLLIYTDKQTQLERLMNREKITLDESKQYLNIQIDIDKKFFLADYIINNNLDIKNLEQEINKFIEVINNEIKR